MGAEGAEGAEFFWVGLVWAFLAFLAVRWALDSRCGEDDGEGG